MRVPPLTEPFEAHSYAVDAFGLLSAPALSGWLQEAAGRHADLLGVGVDALQDRGLTWVLARQAVVVDRPVAYGERAEVVTWPSGADRLSALRDFEVRVAGEVRARAVTQWIVLDLATRKPVRPGSVLPVELVEQMEHVLPLHSGRPAAPEPPGLERPFTTRYRDIDRNLHVTNASYVEWACEAIPEEIWRSRRTPLRRGALHRRVPARQPHPLPVGRGRGRGLRPLGAAGRGWEGTRPAPHGLGGPVAAALLHRGASSRILHDSREPGTPSEPAGGRREMVTKARSKPTKGKPAPKQPSKKAKSSPLPSRPRKKGHRSRASPEVQAGTPSGRSPAADAASLTGP